MRYPKRSWYKPSYEINQETYKVQFVKVIDRDPAVMGICDNGSKVIRIQKGLSPKERFATFVHELLHALEAEWEIHLPHKTVYALEEALIQFFTENY